MTSSIMAVVNSFDPHIHSDDSLICVAGPNCGLQAHAISRQTQLQDSIQLLDLEPTSHTHRSPTLAPYRPVLVA